MAPKINIGIATVMGIVSAVPGALDIVVKVVQEGENIKVTGPDKYLAIFSLVGGGITMLGRYAQAVADKLKGR